MCRPIIFIQYAMFPFYHVWKNIKSSSALMKSSQLKAEWESKGQYVIDKDYWDVLLNVFFMRTTISFFFASEAPDLCSFAQPFIYTDFLLPCLIKVDFFLFASLLSTVYSRRNWIKLRIYVC